MRNEQSKGSCEIEIFSKFVIEGNFPYDLGTVEKCSPPEPDIICTHQVAGIVAFELVEICDPKLAEFNATIEVGGVYYMRIADPTTKIIKKKLSRTYETRYPIELLCYTEGRVGTPASIIAKTIFASIQSHAHPFHRVWFFSGGVASEVWSR
ncbi:MAG: hypothetical protein HRU77_00600 [Gammaproteobacteria bacterium]|nr:MAG: hypothetical protein HRU77_00600 [Gammaproteobacteria bacterium]